MIVLICPAIPPLERHTGLDAPLWVGDFPMTSKKKTRARVRGFLCQGSRDYHRGSNRKIRFVGCSNN